MVWKRGESKNKGEENPGAKITPAIVREIRKVRACVPGRAFMRRDDPRSLDSLARRFGISRTTVSHIACGRRWGHVT